jgi:probable F420-dependent oxidoreductase
VPVTLPHVGIWTSSLGQLPATAIRESAAEIEELGFASLWVPEALWADPFAVSTLALDATSSITVATGIANIHARAAQAMVNAAGALRAWYPGRFLLGLGVSHQALVEGRWKGDYGKPLSAMKAYLDALDGSSFAGPAAEGKRVLAALGPKMVDLAGERADGIHPYTSPVAHTSFARERLGPGPLVIPEVKVLFEEDADVAREIARRSLPLRLPNYANNLIRMGFDAEAVARADDHVVDALVAWGTDDAIRAHLRAHLDAGADQVAVQLLTADGDLQPRAAWRRLADLFS